MKRTHPFFVERRHVHQRRVEAIKVPVIGAVVTRHDALPALVAGYVPLS